ncbi:hypothetical protein [Pseudaminobacter soli (ex Li et al. 2025)]|uniref:hypothetical protein n=1 Tax=Pseudaminobacter soli (ex Li et al. 2025) TaxID=1295366 RepID=UPI0011B290E4|nr:hypothetical protein [Mesorhizobium soli]
MSSSSSMISRLAAEVRESQTFRNIPRETAAARFLAQDVENSHTAEAELRKKLAAHLVEWETTGAAIVRWHDEGRASGRSLCAETQRRIDNDTDGTRRRATETKDRNRLV